MDSIAPSIRTGFVKSKTSPEHRSEMDGVLAVSEGKADVAFGLACFAKQYNLDFVSVIKERFDLLVCCKGWFDGPFQALT